MFELICGLVLTVLKAIGLALAAYIFYWRVWDYTRAERFYRAQGKDVCQVQEYYLPVLGNSIMMAWSAYKSYKEGDNYFFMHHYFEYMTKTRKARSFAGFVTNQPGLCISDVKVVEAMYTTKNKYFDKHPLTKDLSQCLTGDSILFAPTSENWRSSRKAISPAFYKGKLEKLVEIAKEAIDKTMANLKSLITSDDQRAEIDVMKEVGLMNSRIFLLCALGVDCAEELVDFWEGGVQRQITLSKSLRQTFANLISRMASPHIVYFPFLATYHITPFERDQRRNAQALRDFCSKIIQNRREEIKKKPDLRSAGDFLTILLVDEHF